MTAANLLVAMRAGRKVGRTLYLIPADMPEADGILVGLVDTVELAQRIVRLWNADLERTAP